MYIVFFWLLPYLIGFFCILHSYSVYRRNPTYANKLDLRKYCLYPILWSFIQASCILGNALIVNHSLQHQFDFLNDTRTLAEYERDWKAEAMRKLDKTKTWNEKTNEWLRSRERSREGKNKK